MTDPKIKMRNLLLDATTFEAGALSIEIKMFDVEIDGVSVKPYFTKSKKDDDTFYYSCNFRIKSLGVQDITSPCFFVNVDDVLEKFEEILTYKLVGSYSIPHQMFVSQKQYEDIQTKYEYMYYIQKKELDECYVCYDPTYGHRIHCGHHICARCFHKCLKHCEQCGEMNSKFECGMCKKIIEYCDECMDDDEKDDDSDDDSDDEDEEVEYEGEEDDDEEEKEEQEDY